MITLFTKDGSRTGNAIIVGEECVINGDEVNTGYLVETDFGNRMMLSAEEIDEMFTFGRLCPYKVWSADRTRKRNEF